MVVSPATSSVARRPDKAVAAYLVDQSNYQVYTATFAAVGITAAQDVFELTCSANNRARIRAVYLNQYSDFGDAAAEILSVQIIRGYTVSGSVGGTPPTPTPIVSGGPAAASAVEINNTTVANTGSAVVLVADAWNIAAGWAYTPPPAEQITVAASERIVVRITAPADSLTTNGTLIWEEY